MEVTAGREHLICGIQDANVEKRDAATYTSLSELLHSGKFALKNSSFILQHECLNDCSPAGPLRVDLALPFSAAAFSAANMSVDRPFRRTNAPKKATQKEAPAENPFERRKQRLKHEILGTILIVDYFHFFLPPN